MMNKCPCIECISFAICNTNIRNMPKPDVCQHAILRKCKELKVYINIYAEKDSDLDILNIDNARRIFGLSIIDRDEEEAEELAGRKRNVNNTS